MIVNRFSSHMTCATMCSSGQPVWALLSNILNVSKVTTTARYISQKCPCVSQARQSFAYTMDIALVGTRRRRCWAMKSAACATRTAHSSFCWSHFLLSFYLSLMFVTQVALASCANFHPKEKEKNGLKRKRVSVREADWESLSFPRSNRCAW